MLAIGYYETMCLIWGASIVVAFIIDATVFTRRKLERYEGRLRHPVNHQPKPKPYDYCMDNNK
jgi:hypothetical protein